MRMCSIIEACKIIYDYRIDPKRKYNNKLLANRPFPKHDPDSELTLAITYAKDNWELYLEYPKEIKTLPSSTGRKLRALQGVTANDIKVSPHRVDAWCFDSCTILKQASLIALSSPAPLCSCAADSRWETPVRAARPTRTTNFV